MKNAKHLLCRSIVYGRMGEMELRSCSVAEFCTAAALCGTGLTSVQEESVVMSSW
jgi:hypothetical protein